jgi:hypothetical protein
MTKATRVRRHAREIHSAAAALRPRRRTTLRRCVKLLLHGLNAVNAVSEPDVEVRSVTWRCNENIYWLIAARVGQKRA